MRIKKAILVRPVNQSYLTTRFNAGEEKEPITAGYFLVAAFDSQDGDYDLLTPGVFNETFRFTGKHLDNGFLEVERREVAVAG